VFERALARSCAASFTEGFNPKPRLEFASPLGLGIESEQELACVELEEFVSGESFAAGMNAALPEGLRVLRAKKMTARPDGKKPSLMAAFWGSEYRVSDARGEGLNAGLAKRIEEAGIEASGIAAVGDAFTLRLPSGPSSKAALSVLRREPTVRLRRTRTFAADTRNGPADYFEVFCAGDGREAIAGEIRNRGRLEAP
jgi:hypothetical protein